MYIVPAFLVMVGSFALAICEIISLRKARATDK
jgi:hypothetical protein